MANSNSTITAPIRTSADVATVLNVSSNNVGYLCSNQHGKINTWSKWKPVRYAKESGITEAELKSVNYGLDCRSLTLANVKANTVGTWIYNPPNRSTDPKRLGDFRDYTHNAQIPMIYGFGYSSKEYSFNTITTPAPSVAVKVSFRRNSTTASNGIGVVGVALPDLGATEVTTGTFGDYIPCVTTCVNNLLYVANAEDTFNGKFGTSVNDMAIILSNFDLWNNAWVSDTDTTNYPDGATDKYKMTLYPRINVFTPTAKGRVHSGQTTTVGTNGYFNNSTYPFLGVPDGTALTIRKYKKVPLQATYSYFKDVSPAVTLAQGVYVLTNSTYTAQCANWGDKVVYFKDRRTIMEMMVKFTNIENVGYTVTGVGILDTTNIWNKPCTIAFKQTDGTYGNNYTLAANEDVWVTVRISYEAGCATSNYVFSSMTSPSYGNCKPKLNLKIVLANGNGETFTPTETLLREVRWR